MSSPEQIPNQGLSSAQRDLQNMQRLLRARLASHFDEFTNSNERVEQIINNFGDIIDRQENKDEMLAQLNELRAVEEKEIFCEQAYTILEPLHQWRQEHLAEFEEIRRKSFNEQGGFIELNQMLSYGIHGKNIHLHVPPNMSTPTPDKLRLIREGLSALVPILEANPEIETITGTSWIVAAHPDILEKKLHFTVTGPISEEQRAQHFSYDHRPIAEAYISREDLIKYYS